MSADFDAWESNIHAFVELDAGCSGADLGAGTQRDVEGVCAGLSLGVKDIIDVAALPTRNGSVACVDVKPATNDAAVVGALRSAGACVLGKTTTTEFALTDPTNCRNPYDLQRSPGGSSSGSGAAVAAGLVDMALGTQTAGSLCRPAAYCGVVGYKPSFGLLPTTGVTPLAVSFDTVGIISSSVGVAQRALKAMTDLAPTQNGRQLDVVGALLPTETEATDETLDAWKKSSLALQQLGNTVSNATLTMGCDEIVTAHRTVMNAEAFRAHSQLLAPEVVTFLQPNFRKGLEAGSEVSDTAYEDARGFLHCACDDFWTQVQGVDAILTLPVPEGAPLLDGTTGFQDWLTPWTVFGGPLICLPWGQDAAGRPRSVMLAGLPDSDLKLLELAERLERLAPALPPPSLPAG